MLKTERSRREIPWTNAISDERKGGKKVHAVVVGSLKEEHQVEAAFCERLNKSPKEPMVLWWYPEPF